MYRDKDLLKLAQGQECLFGIHRNCMGDEGSTTVACHDNSLQSGKGMALKADDSRSVWGCYYCHSMLDQGQLEYEEKQEIFHQAYIRQVKEWLNIAQSPTMRPWKIEAAKRVLDHLGVKYE